MLTSQNRKQIKTNKTINFKLLYVRFRNKSVYFISVPNNKFTDLVYVIGYGLVWLSANQDDPSPFSAKNPILSKWRCINIFMK